MSSDTPSDTPMYILNDCPPVYRAKIYELERELAAARSDLECQGQAYSKALDDLAAANKRLEEVKVLDEAVVEMKRAMRKFPQWPTDPIHAATVIAEESGELQKSVLEAVYEPHKGSKSNIRTEAIQTAAMCLRFLASFDKYEWFNNKQHTQALAAIDGKEGK